MEMETIQPETLRLPPFVVNEQSSSSAHSSYSHKIEIQLLLIKRDICEQL